MNENNIIRCPICGETKLIEQLNPSKDDGQLFGLVAYNRKDDSLDLNTIIPLNVLVCPKCNYVLNFAVDKKRIAK